MPGSYSDPDRCRRCRRRLDQHAVALIDSTKEYFICPTTEGRALDTER